MWEFMKETKETISLVLTFNKDASNKVLISDNVSLASCLLRSCIDFNELNEYDRFLKQHD
jgi:hypothetical protein